MWPGCSHALAPALIAKGRGFATHHATCQSTALSGLEGRPVQSRWTRPKRAARLGEIPPA
jgi:hypothetical protein